MECRTRDSSNRLFRCDIRTSQYSCKGVISVAEPLGAATDRSVLNSATTSTRFRWLLEIGSRAAFLKLTLIPSWDLSVEPKLKLALVAMFFSLNVLQTLYLAH